MTDNSTHGVLRKFATAATLSVAAMLGTAAHAEAEFKLRWAHYLPNSDFLEMEKGFAEEIKERTGGRVEIEIVYAGGLGKANEVLTLTGRGAVDMASGIPGFYADQLLFWKAYQLPFVFSSTAQAVEVSNASYKALPYFAEELDRMNLQFLMHQPLGSYYMTGKDANCTTVEGLDGRKIRSFGADVPRAHSAVGGVPVTVGTTDIYEALERGTLDYSFLSRGVIASNRWYEVAKFNCGPVMSIAGHIIVMGTRTWDKLPSDIQDIILEVAAETQPEYIQWSNAYEVAAMARIKEGGGNFSEISPDEMAKWKAAAPDFLEEWVSEMSELGKGEQARAVADFWQAQLAASE